MLDEDLERSFSEHLDNNIPRDLRVDLPGEYFSPEKVAREWIEPRIIRIEHPPTSRSDEETDNIELQIRCFVKVLPQGKRSFTLSRLVDKIRAIVDGTIGAPAAVIRDSDLQVVGQLVFNTLVEDRVYNVNELIRDQVVKGLDIATLTINALGTGGRPCLL